jgi:hypothetical protein
MPSAELLDQAKDMANQATAKAEEYSGVVGAVKDFIVSHFGQNGLIAAYIALAVIALVLLLRVVKTSLAAVKYLALPALILAALASYFFGISFTVSLPVTVTACSLLLLFKG